MLYVIATMRNLKINGEPVHVTFTDMAHEKEISSADVFALSSCTLDYPETVRIAQRIKDTYNKPIIVGGPHFDAISEIDWKQELPNIPINYICRGEGETTIEEALQKSLSNPTEKAIITQKVPLLDLDTVPLPAIDVLDKEKYFKEGRAFAGNIFKKGNSATMMTSRGCPFLCSFCASPALHHKRVRFRTIENIRMELELLQRDYNVTEIRFQDDCFTINDRRFEELTDLLEHSQINYRCSMRVDQVEDKTLKNLWRGGCREVGFGIESAEDHVLKLLNKKTTVDLNRKGIFKTKEAGFRTRAFMMTGLPGETKDSAKAMIDFLEETQPDVVTLTSFMPLPGSDIYNHPEKYGVTILDRDWKNYDISIKWQSQVPFVHRISTATIEEMEVNRELLKEYLFNKKKSNISTYNKEYTSDVLHKHTL
jgi:radical SAM superfamily enzyme YgiQ (UPF0313 family)